MGDEVSQPRQTQLDRGDETPGQTISSQSLSYTGLSTANAMYNVEQQPYLQQSHGGGAPSGLMDMHSIEQALPSYSTQGQSHQAFQHQIPGASIPNQQYAYTYAQSGHPASQPTSNYPSTFVQPYAQQHMQIQPPRQHQQPFPQMMGNLTGSQAPFAVQNPGYIIQSNTPQNTQFLAQMQSQQYVPQYSTQYGRQPIARGGRGYQVAQGRMDMGAASLGIPTQQLESRTIRRTSSNSSMQGSVLRGPPRKPKQSGHALWVGNLPPAAHIVDLKDHFSRDARGDIESVFLISKSNCAFVNYKTEASCAAAMTRFHDSRFQGVRLVCRLRRGSTPTSTATTPAPQTSSTIGRGGQLETEMEREAEEEATESSDIPETSEKVKEKFFVVKSLTVEDLERSVQSGVWATQAHNEMTLNKAFSTADSVYLIFSANKSGEYFGYARMSSAIDDEAAASIEFPARPETSQPLVSDLPLAIPTPATTTAPRGRIIDDSARGTIFWEAEHEEEEKEDKEESSAVPGESDEPESSEFMNPATPQTFGKPFKVVWMSTERLPFHRTRGMRNPWNANREVKIARDGTEIEPSVGRRLISMFQHPQMTPTGSGGGGHPGDAFPGMNPFMSYPGQMQSGPFNRPY